MWQDGVFTCVQLIALVSALMMTRERERPSRRHCLFCVAMGVVCSLTSFTLGLWMAATVQLVSAALWTAITCRPYSATDTAAAEHSGCR